VRRVALAASVAAAFALMSARATADVTKDQCVDSNTNAQSLRRDGKFTAARRELVTCGNPSCPALVRDDCARRLDELERVQPSIVIDAKDGAGQDLAAVEVQVDGQTVADHLVGTALRVDPGSHVFTFTVAGKPSVTRTFVLKEGERDRREQVRIGAPADAASEVPAPVPGTGRSTLGLVVGGVGVVGLGVGSAFGLLALSATNQQKTDCASPTSCPTSARRRRTTSPRRRTARSRLRRSSPVVLCSPRAASCSSRPRTPKSPRRPVSSFRRAEAGSGCEVSSEERKTLLKSVKRR